MRPAFVLSKIVFFAVGDGRRVPVPKNLALPLGELSPQATERAYLALPLGELSPQATERDHLALPLGELSAKLTERVKYEGTATPVVPLLFVYSF